ncbi:MAG: LbtU family siderophore porin [Gammaproteobacteria bacterium]
MKKSWLTLALVSVAFSPAVLAVSSQTSSRQVSNNQTTDQAKEIADLKKRLEVLEKDDGVAETRAIGVGNKKVFGIGSDEYNEVLFINDFGINTDLSLLHQRRFVHHYFHGFDNAPRVMLSGNASGTVGSHSHALPINAGQGHQFMEASVLFDTVGYANEDWLAYMQFTADAFGEDTDLGVKQAFVTYGNFDKLPVYLTMGYQYVPFGSYTTAFITDTLVQDLSRTQVPAMTGGYVYTKDQLNLNASAFWFDGKTHTSDQRRLNQWGLNAQLRNEKLGPSKDFNFTVGASFMNNLASSNSIKDEVGDDNQLKHYVPAADVRFQIEKGAFTFYSEYVQALQGFSDADFTQTDAGDEPDHVVPEAAHFEASYSFPVWGMKTELSLEYDQTVDALAFELPQEQYGASYQLTPYENTYLTFEYMHKIDYDEDVNTTAAGVAQYTGTGLSDDMFQMQVNVYF